MKKLLLLSLSFSACGMLAQATTIACTVITGPGVTAAGNVAKIDAGGPLATTAVFSCPGLDAGSGFNLTNVQLLGTGDYDGGPLGVTSGISITEVFNLSSGPFFGAADVSLTVTGGASSNATSIPVPFQVGSTLNPGVETLAGFSVNLSSIVNSGTVAETSAQMVLSFDITPTTTSGTPEPATLGLMGSSLIGLGLLTRRRKK